MTINPELNQIWISMQTRFSSSTPLERDDVTTIEDLDTGTLVTLFTLLSDVQRNANDLRTNVSDVLLNRLHYDRPVYGSFGSVQRTTCRNRSLKEEFEVFDSLEKAGSDASGSSLE